jgi:hypothetical protein
MAKKRETFTCPHCGAQVPVGAAACRQCGADEESGWGDHDDTGLADGYEPDDDFDYDEYVAEEFPEQAGLSSRLSVGKLAVRVVIVLAVISLALAALLH